MQAISSIAGHREEVQQPFNNARIVYQCTCGSRKNLFPVMSSLNRFDHSINHARAS